MGWLRLLLLQWRAYNSRWPCPLLNWLLLPLQLLLLLPLWWLLLLLRPGSKGPGCYPCYVCRAGCYPCYDLPLGHRSSGRRGARRQCTPPARTYCRLLLPLLLVRTCC